MRQLRSLLIDLKIPIGFDSNPLSNAVIGSPALEIGAGARPEFHHSARSALHQSTPERQHLDRPHKLCTNDGKGIVSELLTVGECEEKHRYYTKSWAGAVDSTAAVAAMAEAAAAWR